MTQYIGVDIIEIDRVRQVIARWGDRFLSRVYTRAERQRYGHKPASLASRFAAKEAVVKALQQTDGISWQHIEIISAANGRPRLNLYGRAKEQANNLGLSSLEISLAHSRDYAVAFAIGNTGAESTPEAP
jgi:holo-[acyl-carrier protein] synthase